MSQLKIIGGHAIWTDRRTYPLRYAQFYRGILEGLERSGKKGITVVDVGCSRGYATYELKNFVNSHGYQAVTIGIDVDENILKEAYTSGRIGHAILALAQGPLPFRDESVDVVVCNSLVEYFPLGDYLESKQEFERILKDDGMLFLNDPYPVNGWHRRKLRRRVL